MGKSFQDISYTYIVNLLIVLLRLLCVVCCKLYEARVSFIWVHVCLRWWDYYACDLQTHIHTDDIFILCIVAIAHMIKEASILRSHSFPILSWATSHKTETVQRWLPHHLLTFPCPLLTSPTSSLLYIDSDNETFDCYIYWDISAHLHYAVSLCWSWYRCHLLQTWWHLALVFVPADISLIKR